MADAYDVTSMYWNPSALAFLQNYSLVMNHSMNVSKGMMIESIASPFRIKRGEVISIGLIMHHRGISRASRPPRSLRLSSTATTSRTRRNCFPLLRWAGGSTCAMGVEICQTCGPFPDRWVSFIPPPRKLVTGRR